MPIADFTFRVISKCPHRENTQTWRAAMIVTGMEGCRVEEVIQALTEFERIRDVGVQDPARWLAHFAGLETEASGKALQPWIELTLNGQPIADRASFRKVLSERLRSVA